MIDFGIDWFQNKIKRVKIVRSIEINVGIGLIYLFIIKTRLLNKKTKRFNSSIIINVKWLNTDASG